MQIHNSNSLYKTQKLCWFFVLFCFIPTASPVFQTKASKRVPGSVFVHSDLAKNSLWDTLTLSEMCRSGVYLDSCCVVCEVQ